jgi:diaminohydroxyphosphoribosylaminopyrimidine deaminase/5-amino-6-(5-phosphoribosylamino)uracil reductase
MRRAAALATLGGAAASPNPQVGCVIAQDEIILGEGYHARAGTAHAERAALAHARKSGVDVKGACAYVTLEPCNHTGKTPPCTEALIEAKVARVVIGSADPNPLVSGAGVCALKAAGIEVVELYRANTFRMNNDLSGLLEQTLAEVAALNRGFFSRIVRERPFVIAKFAMTLDGKIATKTGASKWITGPDARRRVHIERARVDAIVTSIGTVLADDPQMNVRLDDFSRGLFLSQEQLALLQDTRLDLFAQETPEQPLRVVCDSDLRISPEARLIADLSEAAPEADAGASSDCRAVAPSTSFATSKTLIATCSNDAAAIACLQEAGVEVVVCARDAAGHVDLAHLLQILAKRGINNVVLEGGPTFLGAAFDAKIVDALQAYIAPKVFGGSDAPSPIAGSGVDLPANAMALKDVTIEQLGQDCMIFGVV